MLKDSLESSWGWCFFDLSSKVYQLYSKATLIILEQSHLYNNDKPFNELSINIRSYFYFVNQWSKVVKGLRRDECIDVNYVQLESDSILDTVSTFMYIDCNGTTDITSTQSTDSSLVIKCTWYTVTDSNIYVPKPSYGRLVFQVCCRNFVAVRAEECFIVMCI